MIIIWLSIGTRSRKEILTYRIYHCMLFPRRTQAPICAEDREILLLSTCYRRVGSLDGQQQAYIYVAAYHTVTED
jgi:hypothetical protein